MIKVDLANEITAKYSTSGLIKGSSVPVHFDYTRGAQKTRLT